MKQVLSARGPAPVPSAIDALVIEYGAWRVLLRAARLLLVRRRPLPPGLDALDDRLLRDIGLSARASGPADWHRFR